MPPVAAGTAGLADRIRAKALSLGFDRLGVARVEALDQAEFYKKWIAEGMHGEMAYLARAEARVDPAKLLPGVRSIVCLLKNYYLPDPHPYDDPSRGVVSRYAWGGDYHKVLKSSLEELARFISAETGAPAKPCLDTSAVLERAWAARAGLGWQGKHTLLLSREYASWFFLGEILTAADLPADEAASAHCGTCERCIDVCPTRAIVAPYILDARKCIAYLTIENRGPIPREIRPGMGNLIFGCDLCQEVCPWNRFAKASREAAFLPRADLTAPILADFMGMTTEEFDRCFQGSPVRRAKRDGFLRNVAVALGNSGSPEAVAPLAKGLADISALVRAHAAWGLGRISSRVPSAASAARTLLDARLCIEEDSSVREEIEWAIGNADAASS